MLTDVNEAGLAETVALCGGAGGKVLSARAFDITDFDAVTDFANDVHEEFGSLDVVMNVAGISAWGTVEHLEHRTGSRWSTSI